MWEEECGGSHEQVRVWWEFSYPILNVNELRRAALASEHLFKPCLSIAGKSRLQDPRESRDCPADGWQGGWTLPVPAISDLERRTAFYSSPWQRFSRLEVGWHFKGHLALLP